MLVGCRLVGRILMGWKLVGCRLVGRMLMGWKLVGWKLVGLVCVAACVVEEAAVRGLVGQELEIV